MTSFTEVLELLLVQPWVPMKSLLHLNNGRIGHPTDTLHREALELQVAHASAARIRHEYFSNTNLSGGE